MVRKPYPSEKLDQYMLRLPDGMRDRLKAAAEANKRTLNAEIIDRLDRSFVGFVGFDDLKEANAPEGRVELARHRLRQALAVLEFTDPDADER